MTLHKPNPGAEYRLLEIGENLKGSFLYLGIGWEMEPQTSDLYVYDERMRDSGLFYRIRIEDPDKAFEKWYGGLMLDPATDGPEAMCRATWMAARAHYLK